MALPTTSPTCAICNAMDHTTKQHKMQSKKP